MRSSTLFVAAACLLATPLASAMLCSAQGQVNIVAQRSPTGGDSSFISTGAQLIDEVEGSYRLSNGRWLTLVDLDQRIYAEFDEWRRVQLQEVGPHRFASREGDVQMVWMPEQRADTILLSYPADSRGRLQRSCS